MIVTVCRTLNEERNIEAFCREYSKISDLILIADGGSEDRTVELAERFSRVRVADFDERVEKDGVWRNPHGRHLNFMFDWAIDEGAEWIIYDDCDSLPNWTLKQVLPQIVRLETQVLMVKRLYLYKDEGHFSEMAAAGYAKWAWRVRNGGVTVYADESDPWAHHMHFPADARETILYEPCCLIHTSYPDDEEIERKAAFYKIAKSIPEGSRWDPLEFGGAIDPLPEWAVL